MFAQSYSLLPSVYDKQTNRHQIDLDFRKRKGMVGGMGVRKDLEKVRMIDRLDWAFPPSYGPQNYGLFENYLCQED